MPLLKLGRKAGEAVQIGDSICVRVERIGERQITLSFEAPKEIRILREELTDADQRAA